jgi:hypothetical protein
MKKISLKHAAALTMGASVFLSGCSKQEAPAPATSATTANQPSATVNESIDAARKSAEDATAEAQKQAAQIKASADAAVADSKKEAEKLKEASVTTTTEVIPPPVPAAPAPATPTGQSQAMTVLTQAKTLYTEKKYPEALAALGGLQNVSLTAEEQTMVNQLKTQISNALAAQGANEGLKSVGGLLQPK